jgi:diadenylate cyclase
MSPHDFNLRDFLRTFHDIPLWQVVVEWLLIGLVVYWSVRFLRGTRGARLLKGIVFLLVTLYVIVRLVGERFGLHRIEFLYGQFLLFASTAIVVVFQPELRRALMRLGETRLFRGFSNELDDDIDVLVASATYLSHRKIGAVIAIEREIGLGGIADTGTRINADLTAPLLNTIFWPNSPLHDMGVVVSNGRIMFAGVQFPLAEVGELTQELGTRHRAAVGMSQESDAVVLVVSEQTGDISIAERGILHRKISPDRLRAMLMQMLGRTESKTAAPTTKPKAVDGKSPATPSTSTSSLPPAGSTTSTASAASAPPSATSSATPVIPPAVAATAPKARTLEPRSKAAAPPPTIVATAPKPRVSESKNVPAAASHGPQNADEESEQALATGKASESPKTKARV